MGIGRAIARGLAAEGVTVCVVARRRSLLEELAREMTATGAPSPAIIEADVMPEGAPERIAAGARTLLGQIDILVNSAGGSQPALAVDAPDSKWLEAMTLNFVRVRQLTHAALPGMIERGWGRVINISGKSEPEGLIAATPAKAAVHAWSKGLSREVGKHGITVNCIPPGVIDTPMLRRAETGGEIGKLEKVAVRMIPVGRLGTPEEIAATCGFLCSDEAAFITGQVIGVNGGMVM